MGVEDKIRYELHQGVVPTELIKRGYNKSTVYKVKQTIKTFSKKISSLPWSIKHIQFDKYGPYKAGEAVKMSFYLYNDSSQNLYVKNIGIQTEWTKKDEEGYFQGINDLVRRWSSKHVAMSFPIPEETNPGESRISFVMEGEFIKEEMPIMTAINSTPIVVSS